MRPTKLKEIINKIYIAKMFTGRLLFQMIWTVDVFNRRLPEFDVSLHYKRH